ADVAAEHIGRSLAEATAVADRLPEQAAALATQILHGAQEAFIEPMRQAYIILGGILMATSLVLIWLAPRRVIPESSDESD
ncbi:hypothetical protein GORHZ_187_00180, partial [Gordonia rhizosphera NBRC 16068]